MAVNFPDFTRAPIIDAPYKGLLENVLKGYQIAAEPEKMAEEQEKRQLANKLQKLEVEHKPKEYQLTDAQKSLANALQSKALEHYDEKYNLEKEYKQSQIDKNKRPGGTSTLKPNAAVANAEYIWNLQHPDGTTTPEEQAEHLEFLKKAFQTVQEHTAKGTERTEILNKTQEQRAPRSPVAKIHYELDQIDDGKLPYTDKKLTPSQQNSMRNDLLLDVVKKTTDPAMRAKLQNGVNMNITLDSINPEKLTAYSGIEGESNKFFDQILEGLDVGPKQYQDYVQETIKASAAAKQMRQYLGDSIQPVAQERLDHLSNPSAWNISPKVAKENFNFIRDLYKRETQTLVRAATDPTLYKAQEIGNDSSGQDLVYNPVTGRLE